MRTPLGRVALCGLGRRGRKSRRLVSGSLIAGAFFVAAGSLVFAVMPVAAETASHPRVSALEAKTPKLTASVKSLTKRLVDQLKSNYQVGLGYLKLYTNADCDRYSYPIMKTCFANNPAAPYIIPVVPSWPGEYVAPLLRNTFGATPRGDSPIYRFDRREAIVVFGVMPPPARYTGIQTYLFSRKGTFDKTSPTYQFFATQYPSFLGVLFGTVPRNPDRIQSNSSIGNSINNVVIQRQAGASFGTLKAFVITPDKTMNGVVRKTLARLGISGKDVFTEPIPTQGFKLGLGRSADDFISLIRYAMPNNPAAGNAWRQTLPLSVLRVRERPSTHRAPRPYPVPVLDTRSAIPEAKYGPDLRALVSAVCQRWGTCSAPKTLIDGQTPPVNAVGPACRQIGMNCLADTQDTTYTFSTNLTLDHGEIYALASALATETGNATYVGISINEASKFEGVANIDDLQLKGSAASYTTVQNTDKLFVYYLTRNCKGLERLTEGRCLSITTDMVPSGGNFKIAQRTYIRPGTERGPDSTQLLRPTVVKVTRP